MDAVGQQQTEADAIGKAVQSDLTDTIYYTQHYSLVQRISKA